MNCLLETVFMRHLLWVLVRHVTWRAQSASLNRNCSESRFQSTWVVGKRFLKRIRADQGLVKECSVPDSVVLPNCAKVQSVKKVVRAETKNRTSSRRAL